MLQVLRKLLAYLEAGELGLHVLLLQMQSCLSEEDTQCPQPKEGGGSDDGVDPECHALRRDLWEQQLAGLPCHTCPSLSSTVALTSAGL